MKNNYIDYNHSIINLMASILKHYGVESVYPTLEVVDKYLAKKYNNVVLMIFDGLGDAILNKHSQMGILSENKVDVINSVFPPTTVAATTVFTTGLAPVAHGLLGWSMYFPEVDKTIDVFSKRNSMNGEVVDIDVDKIMDTETIYSKIKRGTFSEVARYVLNPGYLQTTDDHIVIPSENLDKLFENLLELIKDKQEKFIYSYWPLPDSTIHRHGTESILTRDVITAIEEHLEEAYKDLDDTLIIVTADHGLIDSSKVIILNDYPDITECFSKMPDIEGRALNFYIKEGCHEEFVQRFNNHFKDIYHLYTHKEIIESDLFGPGTRHPRFADSIGDYLGIAYTDVTIIYHTDYHQYVFKGHHAGITKEEIEIPLIIIEKPKREF